jgi:dsDNA-specific endonuclease/ATPase MutS2
MDEAKKEKHTRVVSINDVMKMEITESINDILCMLEAINTYEMILAKHHLMDSLTLIKTALDMFEDDQLNKKG